MTERNLWNGWNKPKAVKWFFIGYLVLNVILWLREKDIFLDRLRYAYSETKYMIRMGTGTEQDYMRMIQGDNQIVGIVCAVVFIIVLAVMTVHRESFSENWDVTLRRIPRFRGKYLVSKIVTVLIPVVGYLVYYVTQWIWRWKLYNTEVQFLCDWLIKNTDIQEAYHTLKVDEFFRIVPKDSFPETVLCLLLTTLALLLLSFTARRLKKDFLGLVAAIAGLAVAVLLFTETFAIVREVEIAVLSVGIVVMAFFTVRHVYVKL